MFSKMKGHFPKDFLLHILGVQILPPLEKCFIITKWVRPRVGCVNLNSDGVSKGNPSISEEGFLLRNSNGDVLWAVAKSL